MEKSTPWIVRIVQMASVLFVLLGCLLVFIYTPFYSNFMVRILNHVVDIEMNQVAAQSQKTAQLTEQETLEPGSELWIARQAYLKLMEQSLAQNQEEPIQDLKTLQVRYQLLQKQIEAELIEKQNEKEQEQVAIPLLINASSEVEAEPNTNQLQALLEIDTEKNKELMHRYTDFLTTHVIDETAASEINIEENKVEDAYIKAAKPKQTDAYAIVVLGGGLTLDKNAKDIIVNDYTRLRLEKTLSLKKQYDLPIVLSGVEAPYMQEWLKHYDIDARLLENRSMNTCENTRFSALLLQKKGGAPKVMLVTDRYHMPRTRRLFALNGIETIPVEAPMPTQLTAWQPHTNNYHHSRRANYEILASLRDIWFGSSDCREVP
jgi:uncharacterized SAM-binding protein YcdF (DUF218 family)